MWLALVTLALAPRGITGPKRPAAAFAPRHHRLRTPQHPRAAAAAPTVGALAAAACIPPTLGFLKSEYTVSYGYALATAATGALLVRAQPASPLGAVHAALVAAYGMRLGVFLLYREVCIPRFRAFTARVERRAPPLAARIPFILSCGLLYLALAAPAVVTTRLAAPSGVLGAAATASIAATAVGFFVGALGDAVKTLVKAKEGEDALVTTGPFAILRHPNYSGEMLAWCASPAAAFFTAAAAGSLRAVASWLAAATAGAAGMVYVLGKATANLEVRQELKYGGTAAFRDWRTRTWAGPQLKSSERWPRVGGSSGAHRMAGRR